MPWQPQHGGHVGDMMACYCPSCVPDGRLVGELWHCEYISNMAAVRHFEFYQSLPYDDMHSAAIAVTWCLSVCPSRSCIRSKRINISSKFFHHLVATPFWFFPTKQGGDVPTGTPLAEASNARGYEKFDDFRPISRCISETVIVRWAHAARQFISITFSFHTYNI